MTSTLAEDVRTDDGHVWLPLDLRGDLAGPEIVDQLVAHVHAVGCRDNAWMVVNRDINPRRYFVIHVRTYWWLSS